MSYATIEEADKILTDDSWTSLTDLEKQAILDESTIKIDLALDSIVCNRDYTQENIYPLKNQTVVPKLIKYACIYESGTSAAGVQDSIITESQNPYKTESTNTASVSYKTNVSSKYQDFGIFGSKLAVDIIYKFKPKTAASGVKYVSWTTFKHC